MKLNNVPSNKFKITLIKMLIEVRRTMDEASDNLKNKRYKILKVQTEIMELQNNNQIGRIRYKYSTEDYIKQKKHSSSREVKSTKGGQ